MARFNQELMGHPQLRDLLKQFAGFVKVNEDNSPDELVVMYLGAKNPDEVL